MDSKVDRQHHPKDCHLGLLGDIPGLLGDILGLLGDIPSNSLQRSRVPGSGSGRAARRWRRAAAGGGAAGLLLPARPASGRAGGGQ